MTHDEFRRKVLNDKERIYNEIINRIPAVKMKLKYLRNEGTMGLCPICGCFFIKKVTDRSIVV